MAYKNTVKDYSQMIGFLTRDKTTDVPGSMAHGLRTGLYDGGRAGFENGRKVSPNNTVKSEASYKVYEDKFGKELLDKAAQDKYGKNFRDLDKTNELDKP